MKDQVVLFGIGQVAEVAYQYLTTDSEFEVVALCVEREFRGGVQEKFGIPVVDFEDIENVYPPAHFKLFAPCSGNKLNSFRERVFNTGKAKGYRFATYVSSKSSVLSEDIGENCFILEHNTIQPYVTIGDNCVLWSGNHIGHHTTIEDHVFISSHVVISGGCTVKRYSWLGVNSTLRDRITLQEGCVVGMGALVTKNLDGNAIYMGQPAKKFKDCDETIVL